MNYCQHVGSKFDPKSLCGNSARWVTPGGVGLCGRHLRYAGPVSEARWCSGCSQLVPLTAWDEYCWADTPTHTA